MMVATLLLMVTAVVTSSYASYPPTPCYQHRDHAAKYKLRHDKGYYPTDKINLVLAKHPYMKDMFYEDAHAHVSVPVNPYLRPLASVCPYNKYTLYSYYYANKDCYVIYPEVQKVTYTQCSKDHNYDCQQCSYHGGGVSKCVEDYDYRYVWAYCTYHATPKPVNPYPVRPVDPYPKPVPYPKPEPQSQPHPQPSYPTYHKPTFVVQRKGSYPYPYTNLWDNVYKPYATQKRWKRSYHQPTPQNYGTIERMALYLPHHCGCKTYRC